LTKWGVRGSSDGLFDRPKGIATDSSGNIYVADIYNHRIQKFTSDGAFLTKRGNKSSEVSGQFSYPEGIAVDNSDNIYVADTFNNRIQKFTSDLVFLTKWGVFGKNDGEFRSPRDIAVDSSGNVYVLDSNHRIQKFTSGGVFLTKWGEKGSGDGQLYNPKGIAVDSSDNVYVTDNVYMSADHWRNPRIQKFTPEGVFLAKWGEPGEGNGQFRFLQDVTIDTSNNVYIVDSGNYRIQKFTSNGVFLAKWGQRGVESGQFYSPKSIAVDDLGNAYVSDTKNNRIQKFKPKNTEFTLNSIGNKTIDEGQLLEFTISATDVDDDLLTYSASNLPPGAAFDPETTTFNWTPTYQQADVYTDVHFEVTDGELTASEDITITVTDVPYGVRIVTPQHNQTIVGTTTILVESSDPTSIRGVYLYAGDNYLGYDMTAPYEFRWNTAYYPDASQHTLKARAMLKNYDSANNSWYVYSDPVTVTVKNDNQIIPSLEIVNPTPEGKTSVGGRVTVNITGEDIENFRTVFLYCDGKYIGYNSLVPFTIDWETYKFKDGTHTLTAKSYHKYLRQRITSEPLQVTTDNTNATIPKMTITNPKQGQTVSGTITVKANMVPPDGVKNIRYFLDNKFIAQKKGASSEVTLNTQYFSNGQHTLKAQVHPKLGRKIDMDTITFNIYNEGGPIEPTVSIDNLQEGQEVGGSLTIAASVSDPEYMTYVTFYVNGKNAGTDWRAPFQLRWDTTYLEEGTYTIKVNSHHKLLGKNFESEINVKVTDSKPAPTLSIDSHSNGDTISGIQKITATSNDIDNFRWAILYVDNRFKGWDFSAPFEINYNTAKLSNGVHKFKLKGYHTSLRRYIESEEIELNIQN